MKLFDPQFYRSAYPSLHKKYSCDTDLAHYFIRTGRNLRHLPSKEFFYKLYPNFKWQLYLKTKGTSISSNVNTEDKVITYYFTHDKQPTSNRRKPSHEPLQNITGKNILINSHSDLMQTAGDTVMVINYMNTLMDNNCHVTLVTPFPVDRKFTSNLIRNSYDIHITRQEEVVNDIYRLAPENDIILIRNHNILNRLKAAPFLSKLIIYGLDIHLPGIQTLNEKYKEIWTQSNKLKQYFISNGIPGKKIKIQEPGAYKYNFPRDPKRTTGGIAMIYCGTLRDKENILEIIDEFRKLHDDHPEVTLKIVYGKIHGDQQFTNRVNSIIKTGVKGITFKYNLSHKEACYEIASSDIGICWRKPGWGENGEVSTKVKEYKAYGLMVIDNLHRRKKTFYVLTQSIVDVKNGYGVRTHQILSMLPNTIALINPVKSFSNKDINFDDKCKHYNEVQYCYYNKHKIKLLYDIFNVKQTIITVNFLNFLNFYKLFKTQKTSFVYDVRGLWVLSHLTVLEYKYKTKFSWLPTREKNAIKYQFAEEQKVFDLCHSCIFICNEIKDYVIKKFNYNKPYEIVENFVTGLAPIRRPRKNDELFCIGYFGSITPYENIDILCKAVQKLHHAGFPVKLLLVGSIHDAIGEDLNYYFNCEYIEYIPWADNLENYYNDIDLYCIPRSSETVTNTVLPIKPYEIMSRKIPLLCSDCNVLANLSHHETRFMLFNAGNITSLYDKISQCVLGEYNNNMLEVSQRYVHKNSQKVIQKIKKTFKE